MSTRQLKPLIVILGGVRAVGKPKVRRHNPRRRSRKALEFHTHEKLVIHNPDQWRAAKRFVKNANTSLSPYTHNTPFGRVALAVHTSALQEFREAALLEAANHNRSYREWQVVVELTWSPLSDDAKCQLLTLCSDELPEAFFVAPQKGPST